jgi:hypothetical protein
MAAGSAYKEPPGGGGSRVLGKFLGLPTLASAGGSPKATSCCLSLPIVGLDRMMGSTKCPINMVISPHL